MPPTPKPNPTAVGSAMAAQVAGSQINPSGSAPSETPESMLKRLLADPKFDNTTVERDFISRFGQARFDKASQ